jgi:hypothetical protein
MSVQLPNLPIGIQNFPKLRSAGYLYVDKTARLMQLIQTGAWYFLARPRRFGKSLTISTLDAMFRGETELFTGLEAEDWVREQARKPAPVLRLDMSMINTAASPQFETALCEALARRGMEEDIRFLAQTPGGMLQDLVAALYRRHGPVVVLIDEYDKPILDHIGDLKRAEEMRLALRGFYTVLKGCDEYLRFVLLTGISRFSKVGVFSAMNNLQDISMMEQYGDITGYTQTEVEKHFAAWIDTTAKKMRITDTALLDRIRDYYDGFCFDGATRLYNPFSVLNFFASGSFSNFWYKSASPSFLVEYMKRHVIQNPEEYRHLEVPEDFADAQEIERARPESFLFQSGYLTIEKREEQSLTLDYPNREVLDSLSRMYLDHVYQVEGYTPLGSQLWKALKNGDIAEVMRLYNIALSGIPYQDFAKPLTEFFYRALFLMLLRGAGVTAGGEIPTSLGRSDVVALFAERVVVLEFKLARSSGSIDRLRAEGLRQIAERGYARPFDETGRAVTAAVIVVNAETRRAVCAD